jgi:hypothetical protein
MLNPESVMPNQVLNLIQGDEEEFFSCLEI